MNAARTHAAVGDDSQGGDSSIQFPVRLRQGIPADRTNLLSCIVEAWGEVPLSVLGQLNRRRYRYGWIGLSDYTMYPLLRPGSFIQIDDCAKVDQSAQYRSEHDRPIYFIELRSGYLCSWCELSKGRLISIPHPLSPCRVQQFAFPSEAEVVGRVTGCAVKLVDGAFAIASEKAIGKSGGRAEPMRPRLTGTEGAAVLTMTTEGRAPAGSA